MGFWPPLTFGAREAPVSKSLIRISKFIAINIFETILISDDEDEDPPLPGDYKWDPIKYELVIRTVKTICDLVCSFPQKCDVVPDKKSEEWTESLVTFYIFSTLASDWHFLWDPYIRGMYIYYYIPRS